MKKVKVRKLFRGLYFSAFRWNFRLLHFFISLDSYYRWYGVNILGFRMMIGKERVDSKV
jgi:hypothetical protein